MSYKKDLKEFKKFIETYEFKQLPIKKDKDGNLVCENIIVKNENGYVGESDKWINVGYSLRGTYPKLLSNLFPYKFKFMGNKLNSIECFFQGIKFEDRELQKALFKYSGKEALVLKETSDIDWKKMALFTGMVNQFKEYLKNMMN